MAPFARSYQLNNDLDKLNLSDKNDSSIVTEAYLPGQPRVRLSGKQSLTQYLVAEFCTQDLEKIAKHLWLLSTFSSSNINALHAQNIRGREIVVTENPGLHLVWLHNRIFIKPLPKYLLSHVFWERFLLPEDSLNTTQQKEIRQAALGYLRTFYYLIRHESDYHIARKDHLRLIPEGVSWDQFSVFISAMEAIDDSQVSQRYSYGELRLTRLNIWAKVLLGRFQYYWIHDHYGSFFSRFYGHLLFVFAVLSIILNAMQVEMAVEQVTHINWPAVWSICRWFSVICFLVIFMLVLCLSGLLVGMLVDEWSYTIKEARKKKRERSNWKVPGEG